MSGLPAGLAHLLPPPERLALFLDVDGTLIGPTHADRVAGLTARQVALLGRLRELAQGALAILTGRTVEMVDAMVAPLTLAVGGMQGADRRFADGRRTSPTLSEAERSMLSRLEDEVTATFPRFVIEQKPAGLSIVFDDDAWAAGPIAAMATRHLGSRFAVIPGRIAVDIVPPGADKGDALAFFAAVPPFAGRMPLHIGDDVPDHPAFAAARRLGGFGIAVHHPTDMADHYLADHAGVWALLESYAALYA